MELEIELTVKQEQKQLVSHRICSFLDISRLLMSEDEFKCVLF